MHATEQAALDAADRLNARTDAVTATLARPDEVRCPCEWDVTPLADGTWDVQLMECDEHA